MMDKRGQTWSVDLLVGLVIFLSMFIGFFALLNVVQPKANSELLRLEAENIVSTLASDQVVTEERDVTVIEAGKLDVEAYESLALDLNLEDLKGIVASRNNFCIYLEDADGNLVPIADDTTTKYQFGIGSEEATLGTGTEIKCGEKGEIVQ